MWICKRSRRKFYVDDILQEITTKLEAGNQLQLKMDSKLSSKKKSKIVIHFHEFFIFFSRPETETLDRHLTRIILVRQLKYRQWCHHGLQIRRPPLFPLGENLKQQLSNRYWFLFIYLYKISWKRENFVKLIKILYFFIPSSSGQLNSIPWPLLLVSINLTNSILAAILPMIVFGTKGHYQVPTRWILSFWD